MRNSFLLALALIIQTAVHAQIGSPFKGNEEADTIYFVELDSFTITARPLKNYNYNKYEAIVKRVYPYADTAVMTLKALQSQSFSGHHDEKQYKKELEDQLRKTFEAQLKKLTRTQGEVLIDIIERNTGSSMYNILKETKGATSAFWWNNLGKMYGYDLKDSYKPTNNPTLEEIIVQYEKKYKGK